MAQVSHYTLTAVSPQLQLGKGGPWIVNSGGVLQAQASQTLGLSVLRVATPVNASDAATKSYVDTAITSTIASDQLVSRTQWARGGSTSITLPGVNDPAGTVGSSGWVVDPTGHITNWGYIQLSTNQTVNWVLPLAFTTSALGFRGTDCGVLANSKTSGVNMSVAAQSTTAAAFDLNGSKQTGPAQTCVFYIEVCGY